jgi:hypothetical protein
LGITSKRKVSIALLAQTLKQTAKHDQLVYFQKAGLVSLSQKGVMNLFVFIEVHDSLTGHRASFVASSVFGGQRC